MDAAREPRALLEACTFTQTRRRDGRGALVRASTHRMPAPRSAGGKCTPPKTGASFSLILTNGRSGGSVWRCPRPPRQAQSPSPFALNLAQCSGSTSLSAAWTAPSRLGCQRTLYPVLRNLGPPPPKVSASLASCPAHAASSRKSTRCFLALASMANGFVLLSLSWLTSAPTRGPCNALPMAAGGL